MSFWWKNILYMTTSLTKVQMLLSLLLYPSLEESRIRYVVSFACLFQFFAQFATQNVGKTSLSLASPEQSFSHILTSHSGVSGSHTSSRTSLRTEPDSQGFSASLLYKGYLDDPRNTDNAWMEAEVWNFHYDIGDNFELRMSEVNMLQQIKSKPNQNRIKKTPEIRLQKEQQCKWLFLTLISKCIWSGTAFDIWFMITTGINQIKSTCSKIKPHKFAYF